MSASFNKPPFLLNHTMHVRMLISITLGMAGQEPKIQDPTTNNTKHLMFTLCVGRDVEGVFGVHGRLGEFFRALQICFIARYLLAISKNLEVITYLIPTGLVCGVSGRVSE